MKRTISTIILFVVFSLAAKASHITGGEMYYSFTGLSNGLYQYNVTLKLFQRCNSGRQFPNPAIISIFDKTNNARVIDISAGLSSQGNLTLINKSLQKFVPKDFIQFLKKEHITEVGLGDSVQQDMSILFYLLDYCDSCRVQVHVHK